nr:PucR family transcriptional regulator [Rhodococcus qingshengii]
MQGLLLRLSEIDADSEAAVRVIAYFDALVERGATVVQLVRATAALAECTAGLSRPGSVPLRVAPDGRSIKSANNFESSGVDVEKVGRLWLERSGGPRGIDDLVLERASISARLLSAGHQHSLFPRAGDSTLVDLVLGEDESAGDRAHALRLLGLDPHSRVYVVVVDSGVLDGAPDLADAPDMAGLDTRTSMGRVFGARTVGAVSAMLCGQDDARPVIGEAPAVAVTPPGDIGSRTRIGIGGPVRGVDAVTSLEQAHVAMRFAIAGGGVDAVVNYMSLGSLALLADVPRDRLLAEPDIVELNALMEEPNGQLDVEVLEAFCRAGSLRQAAVVLHMHHSSVAARLANISRGLGWPLDGPDGLFRTRLALTGRRLAATA